MAVNNRVRMVRVVLMGMRGCNRRRERQEWRYYEPRDCTRHQPIHISIMVAGMSRVKRGNFTNCLTEKSESGTTGSRIRS